MLILKGSTQVVKSGPAPYPSAVIRGAHFLLYSTDPESDRGFFRDVLALRSVDIGGGWLIFQLPPAELAVHPSDGKFQQQHGDAALMGNLLFLMCDNIRETVENLEKKGVACSALTTEDWGTATNITLPSGGRIGLYEPSHPTAIDL